MVVALLVLGLAWIYFFVGSSELFELVQNRVLTAQSDDGLAMRGYDRIVNHPNYLVFGAGEGAWWRFDSYIDGELHSSIGTLLFSYGIVGLGLFTWFLVRAAGDRKLLFVAYACPLALYGLTHNGLRFTLMWELLAVLSCVGADTAPGRWLSSAVLV